MNKNIDGINRESCFTTKETADELLLSPGTLKNWRVKGKGPPFIKGDYLVYYLKEDVLAYKKKFLKFQNSTAEGKV